MDARREPLIERTRTALDAAGVRQALLSSPETVAQLTGLDVPWEDWPIADPFTAAPPMLLVTDSDATLVVPTLFADRADLLARTGWDLIETRTHRFRGTPPDPFAELVQTLAGLPWRDGPIGVQRKWLPVHAADALRAGGRELRWIDQALADAGRCKLPVEVDAVRAACAIADLIQRTVAECAEPGQTEAELAGIALAAVAAHAGRRLPALLTIDAGAASGMGSSIPSDRRLRSGDLVLTDTSPWVDGAWSDTANATLLGAPTIEHRRVFDAVRRSLELAIELSRPGAVGAEIDARVRESLADFGDAVYKHHTGHGLGATWNEAPQIIPGSDDVIEEGMVIAVEPAIYVPGWGGIRLEHVFLVGAHGNELLSRFEHRL
jgi:Xaa-Pro dipeptidase